MLTINKPSRLKVRELPGLGKPDLTDGIPDDLALRRKAARREFLDCRRQDNATDLILRLPGPSESVHFVCDGRFEPCDLIPMTGRLSQPAVIDKLIVTTLGFNIDNVACLTLGMDRGKILHTTLIVSHYFAKSERELFEHSKQEIEKRGGTMHAVRTHTKLFLMSTTDGNFYSIEGSGNLRSCKSIEQFCITNDRPLFEFHENWLTDYLATTGKK